jgi:outer membrane lipoprotein-sorting protein
MPILSLLVAATALQATNIERYFQDNLQDISFTTKVVKSDQNELKKINNDFGQIYRFDTVKVEVKEPFMVRLDASVEDTHAIYLVNGMTQLIRVPKLGVHQKTNLSDKPGRRQTVFDFGLLTSSLFNSYLHAKFVRIDRETGDPVFDINYQDKNDATRSRIWVDSSHKIIAKREWYNRSDRQLATFFYTKPIETNGIWMPTRVEVRNVDDKVAGITQYSQVKVNSGISDSSFVIQ